MIVEEDDETAIKNHFKKLLTFLEEFSSFQNKLFQRFKQPHDPQNKRVAAFLKSTEVLSKDFEEGVKKISIF